jgi:hypothetical protein
MNKRIFLNTTLRLDVVAALVHEEIEQQAHAHTDPEMFHICCNFFSIPLV